jgi:protoporphyrinogen/coproporphyrinogen III oxidase
VTVVVLGGGITGLSSAHALGKAGIPTLLLEASDRLGGKATTESIGGFLIERGPDSFVSYRPAAVELCRELGLGDSLISPLKPRTVSVRAGGRFARLPDGMGLVLPTRIWPFITSDLFSPLEKLRMGLDLLLPREVVLDDVAVGAFLERRLGRALVARLAGPLIGGVYGTPVDELSLDAVVPQLRDAERRHRSLLLASLADGRARSRRARPAASPFVSLAGGIGQLTDALIAAVRAMPGVEIRTGVAVTGLEIEGSEVAVLAADGSRIRAEAIVLATPAPVTAGLLEAERPEAARHIREIPHGSSAVVSLGYPAERLPDGAGGHGFLVAAGEPLTVAACTLSSHKWAGRAPVGTVLVRAFIAGDRAAASVPDGDLIAAARRDLAATLGLEGEPMLTRVARHPDAMPHYTVGHLGRVAAATAALADSPQIVLAGAAYRGVGLPDCIAQGRAAAARIRTLLGGETRPESAPTGSPEAERSSTPQASVSLVSLPKGRTARIRRVAAATDGLAGDGIRVGANVEVLASAPLGGALIVRVGRARIAVPRAIAAGIEVESVPVEASDAARQEVVEAAASPR